MGEGLGPRMGDEISTVRWQLMARPTASDERAPTAPALVDRGQTWRTIAAILAALLIHALAAVLLLVALPLATPPAKPPEISVEVVMEQPKPEVPKPQPPKPSIKAEAKPVPVPPRESGGDPNLKQGMTAEERLKEKAQATPEPKPVSSPETPLVSAEPTPPPKEKTEPAHAALAKPEPARNKPSVPDPLRLPGEGGGDRYLNEVRDQLLQHRVYPAEAQARGLSGTAIYRLVVDRSGKLLNVQLLHSSGYHELDDAGLETIELTAPLHPLPSDLPGPAVALVLTLFIGP
jgi:TonB family protein